MVYLLCSLQQGLCTGPSPISLLFSTNSWNPSQLQQSFSLRKTLICVWVVGLHFNLLLWWRLLHGSGEITAVSTLRLKVHQLISLIHLFVNTYIPQPNLASQAFLSIRSENENFGSPGVCRKSGVLYYGLFFFLKIKKNII